MVYNKSHQNWQSKSWFKLVLVSSIGIISIINDFFSVTIAQITNGGGGGVHNNLSWKEPRFCISFNGSMSN